ncbi:MAG TPA: Amuc_1099 family pilus-like system protein [Chthoniobacterales bacterium]|jgi:hypothetical protein
MEWLRAHYERVVLAIAALLLLYYAISIARNAVKYPQDLAARQVPVTPKKASPPREAVDLARAQEKLQQPAQWAFRERTGLFVPDKHFIGPEGLPVTLKTSEVHPPVPNEWLETYGLPIADADVLSQDPDSDGFNNLDEWQGHTNPVDKNSHPEYLTKLKMKSFTEEPFRFVFSSWVGDTFAINTIDMAEPTQFLRINETIAGTRFKIAKFTPKNTTNQYGTTIDVSELTLQHLDTKEQMILVKEKVAMSPESVVSFEYAWPCTSPARDFVVRRDQEFSLKPNDDIKYKLIDVQPTKAVIANTRDPDKPIEIGLLSP